MSRILLYVLIAHLVWCAARIPHAVGWKRYAEVRDFKNGGATRFFFEEGHPDAVEPVEWLLANTPKNAIIAWRGQSKGTLEIAAAVLFPRLLVHQGSIPDGATHWRGRPVARDGSQTIVLLADGNSLERTYR